MRSTPGKNRENDLRVKKEIDHTIKEVEFINRWLEAVDNSSSDKELESRRSVALSHLDSLMLAYQNYCSEEKFEPAYTKPKKSNKWFYAISVFLGMGVLGLFVDDEGNWSITYFQNNLDSDTLLGFGFLLVIWVYFLINSSFFDKRRDRH